MSSPSEENADRLSDGLTPFQQEAIVYHEIYKAFIYSGFSPQQALWLLGVQMTQVPGKFPPEGVAPPQEET